MDSHSAPRAAKRKILHPTQMQASPSPIPSAHKQPQQIVRADGTDFVLQTVPSRASLSPSKPRRVSSPMTGLVLPVVNQHRSVSDSTALHISPIRPLHRPPSLTSTDQFAQPSSSNAAQKPAECRADANARATPHDMPSKDGDASANGSFSRSRLSPTGFESDEEELGGSSTYELIRRSASDSSLPLSRRQQHGPDPSISSMDTDWDHKLGIASDERQSGSLLLSALLPTHSPKAGPSGTQSVFDGLPSTGSDRTISAAPLPSTVHSVGPSNLRGLRVTSSTSEAWDNDYLFQNDSPESSSAARASALAGGQMQAKGGSPRERAPSNSSDEDEAGFDNWDDSFSWAAEPVGSSLKAALAEQLESPTHPSHRKEASRPESSSSVISNSTGFSARLAALSDAGSSRHRSSIEDADDDGQSIDFANALGLDPTLHHTAYNSRPKSESSGEETEIESAASHVKYGTKTTGRRSLGQALGFVPKRPSARHDTHTAKYQTQPESQSQKRGSFYRFSLSRSRTNIIPPSTSQLSLKDDGEAFYLSAANLSQASIASLASDNSYISSRDEGTTSLERTYTSIMKLGKALTAGQRPSFTGMSSSTSMPPDARRGSFPGASTSDVSRDTRPRYARPTTSSSRHSKNGSDSTDPIKAGHTKRNASLSLAFGLSRTPWRSAASKSQADLSERPSATARHSVSGAASDAARLYDLSKLSAAPPSAYKPPYTSSGSLRRDFSSTKTLRADSMTALPNVVQGLPTRKDTSHLSNRPAGGTGSAAASGSRSVSVSTASSFESSETGSKLRHKRSSGCETVDSDATHSTSVGSSPPGGYFPALKPARTSFVSDTFPYRSKYQTSSEALVKHRGPGASGTLLIEPDATIDETSSFVSPAKAASPVGTGGKRAKRVAPTSAEHPTSPVSPVAELKQASRRNSLGDLKIPSRISRAQTGIRNNMNLVRDFAKGIEELKLLKEQYLAQAHGRAPTVVEGAENWLECADVLIGLGEGRSEADTETRADMMWQTPLANRTARLSNASSYVSQESPSDPYLPGARNVSGASHSTTDSMRSVDMQRELDILSAILGGTRLASASSVDLVRSKSTSQDTHAKRVSSAPYASNGARTTASKSVVDFAEEPKRESRTHVASNAAATQPPLASTEMFSITDGNRSSKRRLRSASRAGLQGLRELIKGFWSPGQDDSEQPLATLAPARKSMEDDGARSKRRSLNLKRRSLVRLKDAAAADSRDPPPVPVSPARHKSGLLALKRGLTSSPPEKPGGVVAPISPESGPRPPLELADILGATRRSGALAADGATRPHTDWGEQGAQTTPTRQSTRLSLRDSGTAGQEAIGRNSISIDSIQRSGGRPTPMMHATESAVGTGMVEKLALRPEAMPGLLVYVQATKDQLRAAIAQLSSFQQPQSGDSIGGIEA